MIKIIKLVKNSGAFYQARGKYTEVYDLPTYLKSRRDYESYKNSQEEFEIIVSENSLFDFFLDLEEHPNVTVEEKIFILEGYYSREDIIRYSLWDNEKAEKIYDTAITKEKNVLKYHFGHEKNIFNLLEIFEKVENKKGDLNIIFAGEYLEFIPQGLKEKFYKIQMGFEIYY